MADPRRTRRSRVRLEWFYNPRARGEYSGGSFGGTQRTYNDPAWRFMARDLTHDASVVAEDEFGDPMPALRVHEAKGWLPADVAVQTIPEARESAPDAVRARYPHLFLESEAEVKAS